MLMRLSFSSVRFMHQHEFKRMMMIFFAHCFTLQG